MGLVTIPPWSVAGWGHVRGHAPYHLPQEDSAEAAGHPAAAAVHARYAELGIEVASASRHTVIVGS